MVGGLRIDMTKYTTAGLHAKVGKALREFFREEEGVYFVSQRE